MAEPPPFPSHPPHPAPPPPPAPAEVTEAPDGAGGRGVRTVDTLRRHACPQCGGKGEWNPRKRLLACPYCGFEFAAVGPPEDAYGPEAPNTVVEHPLLPTLERLGLHAGDPGQRRRRVRCRHCEAVMERSGATIQSSCDFCGSPELVEYEASGEWIRPESLLPLVVPKERAYQLLRQWLGSRFWAPNSLKRSSLVDRLHGVYLPYWTFDAHADCPWTADSGTYYYETESYRDASGRTQTRQVRKVHWTPASGRVEHFFDDVCVPAGQGSDRALMRKIEPFPTADLVPYATDYLSGWQVEAYQLGLLDAARHGEALMVETLRSLCASQVPGDTYRNLSIRPTFSEQTFKHILVPVWIVAYQHRGRTWQSLVNGVSGKVAGRHPISWVKVAIAVILGLLLILLMMVASQR